MTKRKFKSLIPTLLFLSLMIPILPAGAVVSESWGVAVDDSVEFTVGYDFEAILPDSVWDVLNDGLMESLNSTNSTFDGNIPAGQLFNLSGLISEFQTEIPDLLNLRMNISSMDERTDHHDSTEIYVDAINASLEAKVAGDDTYQALDLFLNEYLTNISDWLTTSDSFPDYVGENISAEIDEILPAPSAMFANAPVGEWATGSNNPDVPDFFYKLGMFPDEEGGPRYGFPRVFFVPTDFDLTDILGELLSADVLSRMGSSEEEESPTAPGEVSTISVLSPIMFGADMLLDLILDHYLQELGIIEFEVREKELYVEFDLSSVNGLVSTFLGLNEFGMYLYDQLGDFIPLEGSPIDMFFGLLENNSIFLDIDPTSIDATAILAIRWDENGILDNFHVEASLGATNTTGGEPISLSFEIDISQGEWDVLSHEFTEPEAGSDSVMTESWGVNIGDTVPYTAGFDIDLTLPTEFWDLLDETLFQMINDTVLLEPEDIVDAQGIFDAIMAEIPNMIHLQVEVVGMDNYATEFDIGNETVNAAFDVIISELKAKLPSESAYGPIEDILSDFLMEGLPNIIDVLPATFGANITDLIGVIPALPGNIIPPIPTIWASQFTFSEIPSVLVDMGMTGGGLFIPTDMDYIPVYMAGRTVFEELMSAELEVEIDFDDYFGQFGVKILAESKRLYVGFDFDDVDEGFRDQFLLSMNSEEEGPDFDVSTFTADAVVSISWDESGKLYNAHIEANAAVDLNSGDPISISIVFDISQGLHSELGGTYNASPPASIGEEFEIPGFPIEVLSIAVSLGIAYLILKIRKPKH